MQEDMGNAWLQWAISVEEESGCDIQGALDLPVLDDEWWQILEDVLDPLFSSKENLKKLLIDPSIFD